MDINLLIVVSANAMERDIQKGKRVGFRDYRTKPINVNNFLDAVNKGLLNKDESY